MGKQKYIIGCSGYYYKDWKGKFYPDDLPSKEWLGFYAETFNTVEMNNSFYRMPKENTVKGWYDRAPKGFKFTLKGSRYITHLKKLKDTAESVNTFYQMAGFLQEKLACSLWQLPGNLHKNVEKLETFCQTLITGYKNVIEFRHQSWYDEEVYEILRKYKTACCIISAPDNLPEDIIETADFAYIRFHGKTDWYRYNYSESELKEWAERIKKLKAKEVYIYFNNDYNLFAIDNAKILRKLLS